MLTTLLKKIKQTPHFNVYIALWITASLIVLGLYRNWHIDKKIIGIVEKKSHLVSAQEAGRIQNMLIEVGEQVQKDQVLAILDMSDLKTILDQLKKELAGIQQLETAQRDRYVMIVQQMALQLENEASDFMDRLSLLESRSTELSGLNAEIERLKNAEKAGLGHSRDLSDLMLKRDALSGYLREQSKDLEAQVQKIEKTRRSRKVWENAEIDSIAKSMLLEQMEYAESLRRQVAAVEHRLAMRTVVAPCEGYVTEMFARPGDVVEAFVPVLAVEESKPGYADIYIPEKSDLQPEPGMKVKIYSSRKDGFNTTGVIRFVHPGFTQAPERLSFRGQLFWARKAQVELSKDHHLIPGEVVNARVYHRFFSKLHLSPYAIVDKNRVVDTDDSRSPLSRMEVPKALWDKTRFEPSGIAWLSDIGKYVIVSDDTGIQDSQSDHAAYVFLMDEQGRVDATPVPIAGTVTINDVEAIAFADKETFYLVSSQNISKKNNRFESREWIIKLKRDGEKYTVQERVPFLTLLLRSYSRNELQTLGLENYERDGCPVLNIEGAAFHEGTLYLGLKEPVSDEGAIIWKLDDVDTIFKTEKLRPNQISLYGHVHLGSWKNKPAGISDLIFDQCGVMWALATIPDVHKDDRMGGLYRIDRSPDTRLEAKCISTFLGLKPEGLCLHDTDRFMVVFDNDNEIPLFCYVNVE